MNKQLRTSQISQNLKRLRFLKSVYLKSQLGSQRLRIKKYLLKVIAELKRTMSLVRLKTLLGATLASLFFLSAGNLQAQSFAEPVMLEHSFLADALAPDLADMDGDGDLDLVHTTYNNGLQSGYLENVGTANEFILDDQFILLPISDTGENLPIPEMADMDGDGDLDYTSLNYDYDYYSGQFHFAENLGGGMYTDLAIDTITGSNLLLLGSFDSNLVDFDGDGDFDLVTSGYDLGAYYSSGEGKIALAFVENIGTPERYEWAAMKIVDNFPVIPNEEEAITTSEIVDFDLDGDLDILLVSYSDYDDTKYKVQYIENLGASYAEPEEIRLFPNQDGYPLITTGDIDGDGDSDIVFNLVQQGGALPLDLYWMENQNISNTDELPSNLSQYKLSEQTVQDKVELNYVLEQATPLDVSVVNSHGVLVVSERLQPTSLVGSLHVDVEGIATGNYFLVVRTTEGIRSMKFIKL